MTDVEKGSVVKQTSAAGSSQVTGDDAITPPGPLAKGSRGQSLLSTLGRRRIFQEAREAHRPGNAAQNQHPEAISASGSLALPVLGDAGPPGLTKKQAFEDMKFVYRYNVLYWRARVFKHSELQYARYGREPCTVEKIDKDLERYSRAMDMYRSFLRRPGNLANNAKVKEMGLQMGRMERDGLPQNVDSSETETWEGAKRAEHGLLKFLSEGVMDIGVTGVSSELSADIAGVEADIAGVEADRERRFMSRLVMALVGGFALITPMLIMTLHSTRLTSLLTTSVFVFAVAFLLAWKLEEADAQEIIGITAAYAAVLVVFVGTSTTATS